MNEQNFYGISPAQVQRIRLGKQWKTNV